MNDTVIKVENLGKLYRIGSARERNKTLREAITDMITAPWRSMRGEPHAPRHMPSSQSDDHIWALKDVSFEIKRGEVVGVIGRNGAGKSTLLKILARITEPTEGRVVLKGRVGSLLEVGTGFHSELTGEENIYLSGTILGMSSREISNKFDEIVAFAEMEKFINTPVKHYSSGMYMRLAFAVAAHLEPEILLIDEVLAVGDAEFQKKCLGKMDDVAKGGRTVLFVSHNMGAIINLCRRSLWIDKGKIIGDGASKELTNLYQSQNLATRTEWKRSEPIAPEGSFSFLCVFIGRPGEQTNGFFDASEAIPVEIRYSVIRHLSGCQIGVRIYNSEGFVVFTTTDSDFKGVSASAKEPGNYIAHFCIPENLLRPTKYYIYLAAHLPGRHVYEVIEQAVVFEISPSKSIISLDGRLGVIAPLILWDTCQDNPL